MARWLRALAPWGLLLAWTGTLWLLAPGELNGDGAGYLARLHGDGLAPGHPLFLPMLRWLAAIVAPQRPLDLVPAARAASLLCSAGALVLIHGAARRLLARSSVRRPGLAAAPHHARARHDGAPALFAAAFVGCCQATMRSATQVEVYGPTLLTLCTCLYLAAVALTVTRPVHRALGGAGAGAALGVSCLLHLTAILAVPALVAGPIARRRPWTALAAAVAALGVVAAGLGWAAAREGIGDLSALWNWLRSSDHGIPYPHGPRTPLAAAWGLARSLIHAPYPHQAATWHVVAASAAGVVCWGALLVTRRGRALPLAPGTRLLAVSWALPLALFAVVFFPSETERWLLLLPALALGLTHQPTRSGWIVLALVALVNLGTGALPAAMDRCAARTAARAEALIPAGALVVSPGNGWDVQLGLGRRPGQALERYPLVHHVGAARSPRAAVARMHARVAAALAVGRRVFVARLRDAEDTRGFKELRWFNLTPADFAAQIARYGPRPTTVPGLWELTVTGQPR